MSAPLSVWTNGAEVGAIAASSRAFHYGDGVFRTLLRHRGTVLDADAQIDKLIGDAARLGLAPDTALPVQLRDEIDAISAGVQAAVIKLMLVRAGAGRGYVPLSNAIDRHVFAYEPPVYPASCWERGVVVQRSSLVLGDQPALAGIKHLNRLEQVMAYRSASADAQEVLLANAAGEWIGGGRSNLFAVHDGRLLTPELGRQGVLGHMRERVLAMASGLGIEFRIQTVTDAEIVDADELFVTNSLIGIWPVRQLDQQPLSSPGSVTSSLMQQLSHPRLVAA
jgi:4-amino-4-deoxychorismate lyase